MSQDKGVAGGQGRARYGCAAHHGSDEDAGSEKKGDNLAWLGSQNRERAECLPLEVYCRLHGFPAPTELPRLN